MSADISAQDPLTLAEAAHARVESDPARAAELADRALRLSRARRDSEAEVVSLHALGFARRELGDPRAVRTLRAAVRVGERSGHDRRAALARRPLAVFLAYRGAIGAAQRELDAACAALDPLELARSEVFRIAILGLSGTAPATLAASDRALATLRRHGDTIWEARLLKNRGFLLAERGNAAAAEPDLARARDLYASLGATTAALGAEYELARVALTRGDLPACLARVDAAESTQIPARHRSALELLRAKALVAGRLIGEARQALAVAQSVWERAGIDDPEGRIEVITLTLLSGDPQAARALAIRAQRSFAVQGRDVYAARAAGVALAAAVEAGIVTRSALRSGRRAVTTLAAAGWRDEALRTQLMVARAAIALGSPALAQRELAGCAALRRRGPVADRIEAWHVDALVRRTVGDEAQALQAAGSGLRLLDSYRTALGASELRATASELGVRLAGLGLRIVLGGEDPGAVLTWADRLRANALRLSPVTPPDSPELRARATDLRRVTAELRRAGDDGHGARSLAARQGALEASIRRLERHVPRGSVVPAPLVGAEEIGRSLGDRALLELVDLDGRLTALTVVDGRINRRELGATAAVVDELGWLRFALTGLTRPGQTRARRATALTGARASAAVLGETLIGPVADLVGDRTLVLVPTGSLHAMPWSMLPQLGRRAVVVAPSAATWLALRRRPRRRGGRTVLVAGPRLRNASAELVGVSARYARSVVLKGREATVAAVMRALDGAALAHLACHGQFRSDSPLFSSLELADGALNAYELQRLRRPPDVVVLSACDLATADARPGDELLGFAAALLAMGTRTVIASVIPVPDASARRLMIALHEHLTAGDSPAGALVEAQQAMRPRDAPLTGFVCLGTG